LLLALLPARALAQSDTYFYVTPWIGTAFYTPEVGVDFTFEDGDVLAKSQIVNSVAYGAFVGIRLSGRLGIEALFSYSPATMLTRFEFFDTGTETTVGYGLGVILFGGNLAYAFSTSKTAIVPYLTAGAGLTSFSPSEEDLLDLDPLGIVQSSSEFTFNFGGGLDIPISDAVLLKADLRDYITSTKADYSLSWDPDCRDSSEGGFVDDDECTSTSLNNIIFSVGVTFRTR
jgi:opacity protein-like surface antigen